jgi:hypothetical protein
MEKELVSPAARGRKPAEPAAMAEKPEPEEETAEQVQ